MEIAEAYVSLIPSAKGFGRGIEGAIGGELTRAGKAGGKSFMGGLGGGVAGLATKAFAPLAAAVAGVKVVDFFKEGVAGASDLAESVNAVRVSYGKAADGVLALGENSATQFGLTAGALNEFAVQFSGFAGTISKSVDGDAAKVFKDIAGRATDFASVMNLDVKDAAGLFQSGLAGETEPLRRFGIDLSAAAVQAFAYAEGIGKAGKPLTEAQKLQARYGLLMQKTAKFQDDFKNTSGGLANQQRILSAQWDTLKTTLGAALLPAITAVAQKMNSLLGPAIKMAGPLVQKLSGFLSGMFADLGKGKGALSPLIDSFKSFGATVGPALASLGGPLKSFFGSLIPVFQKIGTNIIGVLAPAFREIGDLIATKFVPAVKAILPILQPVAKFLIETLGGAITGALSGAMKVIQGVITAVSGLLQFVANVFQGNWGAAWQGIKDIVAGVFKAIVGAVQVFMNVGILKVFRLGVTALRGLWSKGLGLLKTGASAAWSGIKALFLGALRGIGSGLVAAVRGYLGFWKGGLNLLKTGASTAWTAIKGLFSGALGKIKDFVGASVGKVAAKFGSMMTEARKKVVEGITKLKEKFSGIKDKLVGALKSPGTWLKDIGGKVVDGLWKGISGAWDWVMEKVRGLTDRLPAIVKRALGIASPSKVFAEIGANVVAGLVRGLDDRKHLVKKATQKVIDQMNSVMADARQAIADFRQQGRDLGATIARSLGTFGEGVNDYLSGLAESATTTTADSLLANMRASVKAINDWRASLAAVAKRGVPNTIVEELRAMGLDSADELSALNAMTDAQLTEWVALWKQRDRSGAAEGAKQFVDDIAGVVAGVESKFESIARNAMKGLAKGLRDEGRAVKRRLQELMDDIVRGAKDALGIKSPSRVFASIGQNIGRGLIVGVDSSRSDVARSVDRMTEIARSAAASAGRSNVLSLRPNAQQQSGAGVAFYGPVTTTDVDAMARKIVNRQRDALFLIGATGVI